MSENSNVQNLVRMWGSQGGTPLHRLGREGHDVLWQIKQQNPHTLTGCGQSSGRVNRENGCDCVIKRLGNTDNLGAQKRNVKMPPSMWVEVETCVLSFFLEKYDLNSFLLHQQPKFSKEELFLYSPPHRVSVLDSYHIHSITCSSHPHQPETVLGSRQKAQKHVTCSQRQGAHNLDRLSFPYFIFVAFNISSTHVITLMNVTYPILGEGSFWKSLFLNLQLKNLFCDRPTGLTLYINRHV